MTLLILVLILTATVFMYAEGKKEAQAKFPTKPAPIVVGIVLGKLAEENFRRSVIMGGYSVFVTRPASLIMLIIAVLSFSYPLIQTYRESKRNKEQKEENT